MTSNITIDSKNRRIYGSLTQEDWNRVAAAKLGPKINLRPAGEKSEGTLVFTLGSVGSEIMTRNNDVGRRVQFELRDDLVKRRIFGELKEGNWALTISDSGEMRGTWKRDIARKTRTAKGGSITELKKAIARVNRMAAQHDVKLAIDDSGALYGKREKVVEEVL